PPNEARNLRPSATFTGQSFAPTARRTSMRANGSSQALPSKELVKEINALKAQLKKLSAVMEADASDGVNRAIGAIETKSKEAVDGAISAAQDFIDEYTEQAKDAAGALAKKT